MGASTKSIRFKRQLAAAPAEVYRAFTHPTALRDWLGNAASAAPHVGGHLYLWWSSGYYANGQYTALEPGKTVAFSWQGAGEPEPTRVRVALAPKNGGTALTLTHAGLGAGKKWAAAEAQIRRGWEEGLENLQSMLETGVDLRVARQPRLGVFIGEFDAKVAERLGVPVSRGIRLEGVAEGTGAAAAGLQKDDVIVRLGGKRADDFPLLQQALEGRQAGETLPVVFYRGSEKRSAPMTLSSRPPAPELPASAAALAETARGVYAAFIEDMTRRLEGVTEAEADRRPAPGEWSLKELVAHFIACERDLQSWIANMLEDNSLIGDSLEFRPNVTPRLAAIVARFGSLPALMEELRSGAAETVALLESLPPEFVSRRHLYQRVAQWIMFVVPSHLPDEHGAQLEETLGKVRGGV